MSTAEAIHSVEKISDQNLYELCRGYGARALEWRQKFIGLLPEVQRRRLFERHGFGSIFEFAAKLAGVSQDQVRIVLNLDKRFEDKPMLKALLENGHVSSNKLARVASVVTVENEQFWANQSQLLPQRALETLVRDARHEREILQSREDPDGLFEPQNGTESLRVQTSPQVSGASFQPANDVQAELDEHLLKRHRRERTLARDAGAPARGDCS